MRTKSFQNAINFYKFFLNSTEHRYFVNFEGEFVWLVRECSNKKRQTPKNVRVYIIVRLDESRTFSTNLIREVPSAFERMKKHEFSVNSLKEVLGTEVTELNQLPTSAIIQGIKDIMPDV